MNCRFLKVPRLCSRASYESAVQKITTYVSSFSEVRAAYRMGTVAVPGISDLDMIVVIREGHTIPKFDFTHLLDADEQYTLMHGPFVVPELFWRSRVLFYHYENLILVLGTEIVAKSILFEWQQWVNLRLAIQHLIRLYFSLFVQLSTQVLRVRSLLCELHALQYDHKALRPLLSERTARTLENLIDEINSLRRNWFFDPNISQVNFVNTCTSAKRILRELIEELSQNPELSIIGENDIPYEKTEICCQISKRRLLFPGTQFLTEDCSLIANLAAWFAWFPLGESLCLKMTNHLGTYRLTLPLTIYNYITDTIWEKANNDRREFIKSRSQILSSWEFLEIPKSDFALPLLDMVKCK